MVQVTKLHSKKQSLRKQGSDQFEQNLIEIIIYMNRHSMSYIATLVAAIFA